MAEDRINLVIKLTGDKEALSSLENIEKYKKLLSSSKLTLEFDRNQIQQDINFVKKELNSLKGNTDDASKQLSSQWREYLSELEAQRRDVVAQIHDHANALGTLKEQEAEYSKAAQQEAADREEAAKQEAEATKKAAEEEAAARQAQVQAEEDAAKRAEEAEARWTEAIAKSEEERRREIEETIEYYTRLSDAIENVGNLMHELSGISSGVADFASSIGSAFGSMSDMFSFDAVDTIGKTLTVLGTKAITGNMDKIRSRFDILSTFSDYMELAGINADDANEALQRVNDSILGLPIGLDESAQRLRRYQMFMDDIEDATNLTIGVQKAITAGGANAQMKNYAYTQIDRLLTVGALTQSRQWYALMNGLGVSMRFIREAMGVENMTNKDLAAGLANGSISTQRFLDALMELGEGSSDAARQLDAALGIYKGTLESWLSNIEFAAIRGGANVMTAFNDTLAQSTGKPIVGYLEIVRDSMNDVYSGVGSYIRENPDKLEASLGAIEKFLDALSKFKASDLADKMFQRLMQLASLITHIVEELPVEKVEDFIAFSTTMAGPLSKLFSAAGGVPILYGVFERFKDFDFEQLFDKIAKQASSMSKAVSGLLGLFSDNAMSDLIAFGLVWGKPLAEALDAVGDAFGYVGGAIKNVIPNEDGELDKWDGGILSGILRLAVSHSEITLAAGAIAALAVSIAAYIDAYTKQTEDIREVLGLNKYYDLIDESNDLQSRIETSQKNFDRSMHEIKYKTERAEQLIKEINGLDQYGQGAGAQADPEKVERLRDAVAELNRLYPDFNLALEGNGRYLSENSRKALENGDAIIELANKRVEAQLLMERQIELSMERIELEAKGKSFERQISSLESKMKSAQAELDNMDDPTSYKNARRATELYDLLDPNSEDSQLLDKLKKEQEENNRLLEDNATKAEAYAQKIAESNKLITESSQEAAEATKEAAKSAADSIADIAAALEWDEEKVEAYFDVFKDIMSDIGKSLDNLAPGFDKAPEIAETTLKEIKGNLESQRDLVKNVDEAVEYLEQYVTETGNADEDIAAAISKVTLNPGGYTSELFAIYNGLKNGDIDIVKDIGALLTEINDTINDTMLHDTAVATWTAYGDAMLQVAQEDPDLFGHVFDEILKSYDPDEKLMQEIMDSVVEDLSPSDDVVKQTQDNYGKMGEAVAMFTGYMAGEEGDATLENAVFRVQTAVTELDEKTFPEYSQALEDTGQDTQEFVDDPLENLVQKLHGGEGSVTNAIEWVEIWISDMCDVMTSEGTISAFNQFIAYLQAVHDNLNAVKKAAQGVAEALAEVAGQEITGYSSGPVEFPGGHPIRSASGGPVYLAKGGFGFFKPRGTDTVPAMLTPGEFVIRKKAVDHVGAGVLSLINRMDIPHAIDALMSRVRMPMGHQFVTYDNRKSYDNHATVNQTINTNNPSFTYRRASRFAHAL